MIQDVLQRNQRIHSGSGFFGSFDAPRSGRSWIALFNKETQNPFSDSFGFKNPIIDLLKETHPYFENRRRGSCVVLVQIFLPARFKSKEANFNKKN